MSEKYQPIERSEIDRAPEGLYRVIGSEKRGDFYDIAIDAMARDVDLVLFGYVSANTPTLPQGCELAKIRADGKRLVLVWGRASDVSIPAEGAPA